MRLKELLKMMFRAFFVITTGITMSMYVFCLIFKPDVRFSTDDIGEIFLMALASELSFLIYYSNKELSKKQMLIRSAIHIPVLFSILLYLAHLWNWVNLNNPQEVAIFFILVLGVYVIVFTVNAYQDKITADKLNDSLKKRYHS